MARIGEAPAIPGTGGLGAGANPRMIGMNGGEMIGRRMIGIGRRIGKIMGKRKALIKGKKRRCSRTPGELVLLMLGHWQKKETIKADQQGLGQ